MTRLVEMEFTFYIPGRPRPKQRPNTRQGSWYTPKRTVEWEKHVIECYQQAGGPEFTGPIRIDSAFTPDGTTVTISSVEWDSPLTADVDNLQKLVQDALQGHAYANDRRVVAISAEKS